VKHRKVALTILAALLASIALAEHFQTINGKEYKNATVSRVEPDGIVLKTKSGITKVYFTELPKDVQERFHYDSAQAARFTAAQQETATQQTAALAEQQRQQEQQRRAEAMRRNTRTVLEVESDQPRFVDQPFMLQDTIEITNYYNFGYVGAEETHYSFEITDSTGKRCAAYMERAKAGDLRERLLSAGSSLKGVFTVVLLSRRYYQSGHPNGLFVELVDYRLEQ
jgi:hypothetical protein